MIPEECMALLTYTNQIDARVQLNEATFDAWWMSLEKQSFDQAKWCVKLHYATSQPNNVGGVPALSPATLRHRISSERERATAKQSALTAAPVVRDPNSFRSRDPDRWDALVRQGELEHRDKMHSRGKKTHNETCPNHKATPPRVAFPMPS